MHEFIEEFKSAHGLKEKKGPGRAKLYDPRAQPPRPSPAEVPMNSGNLARLGTGLKPERQLRWKSLIPSPPAEALPPPRSHCDGSRPCEAGAFRRKARQLQRASLHRRRGRGQRCAAWLLAVVVVVVAYRRR